MFLSISYEFVLQVRLYYKYVQGSNSAEVVDFAFHGFGVHKLNTSCVLGSIQSLGSLPQNAGLVPSVEKEDVYFFILNLLSATNNNPGGKAQIFDVMKHIQ